MTLLDSLLLPLAAAVLGVTLVEDHQICQALIVATTAANHLRVVSRMAMTPGEVTVAQENPDDPEARRLTLLVMTTTMVDLAVMPKSMDSIRGVAKRCISFCDEPIRSHASKNA